MQGADAGTYNTAEWDQAILLTPRRAVRDDWNSQRVHHFSTTKSLRIYESPALDTHGGIELTPEVLAAVAAMNPKDRADLPDMVEIVVGMPCMVTENVNTALGLANGSRGKITGICLDPREPVFDENLVWLHSQFVLNLSVN